MLTAYGNKSGFANSKLMSAQKQAEIDPFSDLRLNHF